MAPKVKKVTSKKRKEASSSGTADAAAAEAQEELPTAEEPAAEPILISDDESEDVAASSEPKPVPPPDAEPCLEVPPIAVLTPGQEPASSDSLPLQARLDEFENAVKQVISLVSLGMGSLDGFRQSLMDRVVDLRRVGENRLATRCMQKLRLLESRMMRLEILLREGPEVDMESCLVHVRRQEAWEQEVRSKEIADLESIVDFWMGQQHSLEEQIINLNRTIARLRAELGQAEANLKGLQSDVVKVSKNAEAETRRLQDLRQEDAVGRSSSEDRIRKAAEDKAREDHARRVAVAREELLSFTLFD